MVLNAPLYLSYTKFYNTNKIKMVTAGLLGKKKFFFYMKIIKKINIKSKYSLIFIISNKITLFFINFGNHITNMIYITIANFCG